MLGRFLFRLRSLILCLLVLHEALEIAANRLAESLQHRLCPINQSFAGCFEFLPSLLEMRFRLGVGFLVENRDATQHHRASAKQFV